MKQKKHLIFYNIFYVFKINFIILIDNLLNPVMNLVESVIWKEMEMSIIV